MPAAKPPEFRRRALDLVAQGEPVARVAKDLGNSESCLRRWMEQDAVDGGRKEGLTSTERKELVELWRRNQATARSALLDLLDALNTSDVVNVIRSAVQVMLQERTEARTVQRDGRRPRTSSTTPGDLELAILKLRSESIFPSPLERRRRIDQALFAVVMEAYVTGTSVRKVADLVKALGADTGISKSEVSRICADLAIEVGAFADRDSSEIALPNVFLDATHCKARIGGGEGG